MNKIKPQFKRFEMHGNLPAAFQYGAVVSASKPTEDDRKTMRIETMRIEFRRAPEGGAMTANARRRINNRYLYKEVDK